MTENHEKYPGERNRTVEMILSWGIILLLLLLLAGLLYIQKSYDLTAYGIVTGEKESGKEALVPVDLNEAAPDRYDPMGEPKRWEQANLFEKINGKAPIYLDAGFQGLVTLRYVNTDDTSLWMELYIYNQGDREKAFSVYSRQRRADAESIPGTERAYRTENAEFFARGGLYVEIIGSEEEPALVEAVHRLGEDLRRQLGPAGDINELSLFPDTRLVNGSEKLYLSSAFGYQEFRNIFTAGLETGKGEVTVFFSGSDDARETKKMMDGYISFLEKEGARSVESNLDIPGLVLLDRDGYFEVLFPVKGRMAGVHAAESRGEAEKGAELLHRSIQEGGSH